MSRSHHLSIAQYIARAQSLGSKATTLKGAGKFILARTQPAKGYPVNRWRSGVGTQPQYRAADHRRRLIARYAGMRKLPRYLDAADRKIIAAAPATRDLTHLLTLPTFIRAYHLTSAIRHVPRLASFVRAAEAQKGTMTKWKSIASDAFDRAPWGQLRKRYAGKSSLSPGIRTETNGRAGWNKVSWHYADYTLIASRTDQRRPLYTMHYVSPDQVTHRVFVSRGYFRIDDERPQKREKKQPVVTPFVAHIQRRILSAHVPAVLTIRYDREKKSLMLVDALHEQYHLPEIRSGSQAAKLVREAVTAFRKRRAEKIAITQPEQVWVTVGDSLEAGNCRTETERCAAQLHQELRADGQLGAVRGDVILALRNDSYARRAVAYAATRHQSADLAA